jgi:hypothetical protein
MEEVRIELSEYKGSTYLNIRAWIKGDNGEFLPTRKGITLNCELLQDLLSALQKAEVCLNGLQ